MFGDERAELQSWRFSKLLIDLLGKEAAKSPTLAQWKHVKDVALKELQRETKDDDPVCEFANRSATQTLVFGPQTNKVASYGIASAVTFGVAAVYASGYGNGDPRQSIIIEIDEQVKRAARVASFGRVGGPDGEYYIPIVLPAADIAAAWTGTPRGAIHGHYMKKVTNKGRFEEVTVYQQAHVEGFPLQPFVTTGVDGRIVACAPSEPCVSDPAPINDPGLQDIVRNLPTDAIHGVYFKFIMDSHH